MPFDIPLATIAETGIQPRRFSAEEVDSIPEEKGAYALFLRLGSTATVTLGKARGGYIEAGRFVYCGSANGPGGLRARLRRHFRADKPRHWHIDQLTGMAAEIVAVAVPGGDECRLVECLLRHPGFEIAYPGFGSSDCNTCKSHLLRLHEQASPTGAVTKV